MVSRKIKVATLSLGQGLAAVTGLATAMVMARVLLKEDLAAYRQTLLAYNMLAPFLSLGVGQGIYYFLPSEETRVRGRVLDGLFSLGAMGLVFAIFIAIGGNEILARRFSNPKVARMLLWMIPYSIVTLPATAAASVFVVRDRVLLSSVFGVVRQLCIGAATLIPLLFWKTAESSLVGNVVASVLLGLIAIYLMIQSVPNDSATPSLKGIKELLFFTLPLALAGMFGTISMQLDKVIVSLFCPPADFAVYALGAIELPVIGIVTGALTSIALADMRRSIVAGKKAEALRLFKQVAEKSSLIIFPVILFCSITADTLIQYLYTSSYSQSTVPFRLYLILLPIRTVVFGSLLMALGKSGFILVRSIVGLVCNLILSALLVWKWGPWGAAVATLLTIYVWVVPANLYVLSDELETPWYNILPLPQFAKVCLAMVPLVIFAALVIHIFENTHIEFTVLTTGFLFYLAVFWNDKLYSFSQLKSKAFSLARGG